MFRRKLSPDRIMRHIEKRQPPFLDFEIEGKKEQVVLDYFSAVPTEQPYDFVYRMCGMTQGEGSHPIELHYYTVSNKLCDAQREPIGKLAIVIIQQAVRDKATEIRITTTDRAFVIENRIDGEWIEAMQVPKNLRQATFERLREMSGSEGPFRSRRGIIQFSYQGTKYDIEMREEKDVRIELSMETRQEHNQELTQPAQ